LGRIIATAAVILCIAVPSQGQQFSLWADEGKSTSEFWTSSAYQPFTIYVFLEPGSDGARGVEYKMTVPSGHFLVESSTAPFVSEAMLGTPFGPPGVSAVFGTCQRSITWVFSLTCMASNTEPGIYSLEPHDETYFFGVVTCIEPGRPKAEGRLLNRFCYNRSDGQLEEASWGVIKRQY
jgi:hypothetical protein